MSNPYFGSGGERLRRKLERRTDMYARTLASYLNVMGAYSDIPDESGSKDSTDGTQGLAYNAKKTAARRPTPLVLR